MKKIFSLFLIAVLAFSLVACGSTQPAADNSETTTTDNTAIRETFDKASAYIESVLDTKGMDAQVQDDDGGANLYKYWTPTDAADNAAFSMELDINGNAVTVGTTTVKDLAAFDWEIEKSAETVKPDEMMGVMLTKDNRSCSLTAATPTLGQEAPIDDCIICDATASYNEFSLPFSYSGLNEQASIKDIVEKLGVPNSGITLSSDANGSIIELSYFISTAEGDLVEDSNLSLSLNYSADSDIAVINSVQLSRSVYKAENQL